VDQDRRDTCRLVRAAVAVRALDRERERAVAVLWIDVRRERAGEHDGHRRLAAGTGRGLVALALIARVVLGDRRGSRDERRDQREHETPEPHGVVPPSEGWVAPS